METQANWPNADQQPNPNLTGKPLNPDPNAFNNPNPNRVEHQALGDTQTFEGSGKDMGIRGAPIVAMHPTSKNVADPNKPKEFKMIDKANFKLNHHIPINGHYEFAYPFEDLKVGQGIYIPLPENMNVDKFHIHMHKQLDQYRKQASEVEKDENGDDVMEDVAINQKKRNDDGTIQLDGDTPRLGIKSGFRPKLLGPSFTVKSVVAGDELSHGNEAEGDGVLVIRMS